MASPFCIPSSEIRWFDGDSFQWFQSEEESLVEHQCSYIVLLSTPTGSNVRQSFDARLWSVYRAVIETSGILCVLVDMLCVYMILNRSQALVF